MMRKYGAKRDMNEARIVQALRMVPGVTVVHLSAPGVPDLLVSRAGVNYLIEVKTAKGKLTEPERAFFDGWTGQVDIVRTVEDALKVIGVSGELSRVSKENARIEDEFEQMVDHIAELNRLLTSVYDGVDDHWISYPENKLIADRIAQLFDLKPKGVTNELDN